MTTLRRSSRDIMADIVQALVEAPRSIAELVRIVDASDQSIREALDVLRRRGLVANGELRHNGRNRGQPEKLYRWTA